MFLVKTGDRLAALSLLKGQTSELSSPKRGSPDGPPWDGACKNKSAHPFPATPQNLSTILAISGV